MSKYQIFYPKEVLDKFDEFLGSKQLTYDGIIVGGAAVALISGSTRVTQDIDVLTAIDKEVKEASIEFARQNDLNSEWFNNRVVNLAHCKPFGWGKNTILVYSGRNLVLSSLSKLNLLRTKVYAYIDRADGPTIDFQDIKYLNPTLENLDDACQWALKAYREENSKAKNSEISIIKQQLEALKKAFVKKY